MKGINFKSFAESKKLRYGALSVAITAVIIAIVIIINSIISVLSEKYNWYLDMTDEQVFSLSDKSIAVFDTMDKNVQTEIIFATARDNADLDFSNLSKGGALAYVYATAELLDARYDNVSVSYHDIIREPKFFKDNFNRSSSDYKINEKSVIIARKNADGTYGEYRVKDVTSFYVFNQDGSELEGYCGELVFAQSLLSLTFDETPTVYFTVGHGETSFTSVEYNEDGTVKSCKANTDAAEIIRLFSNSGFKILPLDLNREDVPADARMVIINNPTFDFTLSEIAKLQEYLDSIGSVMCFTDYNATNLSQLYGFAETFGGVSVNAGIRIYDNTNAIVESNDLTTPYRFLAQVADNKATSTYFASLANYASAKARFENAAYLTVDSKFLSDDGYDTGSGIRFTKPLIQTYQSARLGESGERGTYSLMSVTSSQRIVDNEYKYSYLVMCPSSEFVSNTSLSQSNVYPNYKMLLSLIYSTTSVKIAVDIDYKSFADYSLDITNSTAQGLTIMFSLLLPAIAVLCGAVVIIRRKRR